jgi:hypothetical protein
MKESQDNNITNANGHKLLRRRRRTKRSSREAHSTFE